jgi:hypothetical protein
MASSKGTSNEDGPPLSLPHASSRSRREPSLQEDSQSPRRRLRQSRPDGHNVKHVHLEPSSALPTSSASSIYKGSYSYSPRRSRVSLGGSIRNQSSGPTSPRLSISQSQLEDLLQDLNLELETYGVEELRDGFFDASFFKPPKTDHENLMKDAEYTLPTAFRKKHPLSPKNFLPKQWHEIKSVVRLVTTTRSGVKLFKSFSAFFIAYCLCLVPIISSWLGRYNYIMVLSTIINHPGRTIGAQIDGALLTIIGSATGLGWGAFALWLSDSTGPARRGYGGVLAAFLVLFMGTIAVLRSYYIRLYQLVLCAGIAVTYTCLANTSESEVHWKNLFSYGIPWLFGQAIGLLICCSIFPDAGARPLAVSLHGAFSVMQDGLVLPRQDNVDLHRQLAWTFVNLSQAYRDLVLDISLTRFRPSDVMLLRNLMQAVIRSLLALRMETHLFDNFERIHRDSNAESRKSDSSSNHHVLSKGESSEQAAKNPKKHLGTQQRGTEMTIDIENPRPSIRRTNTEERAVNLVSNKLAQPTIELLSCMRISLARCDAVVMDMSGHRKYLGPSQTVSSDIVGVLTNIRKAMIKYDEEEDSLLDHPDLPPTYSNHPEVVELFLFVHPIRQAATNAEALLVKVMEMQQKHLGWAIYLPSYPFFKSLQRTNAQVRHDRGGVTAGYYFRSQAQLAHTMKGMANIYRPLPRQAGRHEEQSAKVDITRTDTIGKYEEEEEVAMDPQSHLSRDKRLRYRLWSILHRLQGFETRFALKVAITTSLLSVPAWLDQSRGWWDFNESWWAVATVWVRILILASGTHSHHALILPALVVLLKDRY